MNTHTHIHTHTHTHSLTPVPWHPIPRCHRLQPRSDVRSSPSALTVTPSSSSSAVLRWTASTNASARYEVWRTFDPSLKPPPSFGKGWLVLGWTKKTEWESVGMEGGTRFVLFRPGRNLSGHHDDELLQRCPICLK